MYKAKIADIKHMYIRRICSEYRKEKCLSAYH